MQIEETQDLSNQFLLAMPGLKDSFFANTITYLFSHDQEGAAGLVINRPIDMRLLDLFEQMELPRDGSHAGDNIFNGGPVSLEQGFVLHRQGEHWHSTLDVGDGIALTTSRDILASIAANEGPDDALVAIGYAGWGAGQLEEELADNAWLTVPASADIIFDTPVEERATAAARILGVDINLLADCAGHA